MAISHSLKAVNPNVHFGWLYGLPNRSVLLDIVVKLIGLLLALTVYPPTMVYAILVATFIVGFASWPNKNKA